MTSKHLFFSFSRPSLDRVFDACVGEALRVERREDEDEDDGDGRNVDATQREEEEEEG